MPSPNATPRHDEVFAALEAVAVGAGATPEAGRRIQIDRGSAFVHLGLATPLRRRRVKQGFSFSTEPVADVLRAWDEVWWAADVADVLFAPLDHYREQPIGDAAAFWSTAVAWIDRVDNWAHADDLARVYSRALEAEADVVYPTLVDWSRSTDQWRRRISMVSLIRYSGKNANFMPANAVLDVVANCVDDERDTVAKAVGWVLRETMKSDEGSVLAFLETHGSTMSPVARRRANGGR